MKISTTTWWILAASVFVGLIILVISTLITLKKVRKVKREYQEQVNDANREISKAFERENHGQLLWHLKEKAIKPLEDVQLEFLVNTALRNNYKTHNVIGSESDYESKTLEGLAKTKESKKANFTIIFTSDDLNSQFDEVYNSLKPNEMIAIVNAPRKNKEVKRLISYIKTIKARYSWTNLGKGIVLVVK